MGVHRWKMSWCRLAVAAVVPNSPRKNCQGQEAQQVRAVAAVEVTQPQQRATTSVVRLLQTSAMMAATGQRQARAAALAVVVVVLLRQVPTL